MRAASDLESKRRPQLGLPGRSSAGGRGTGPACRADAPHTMGLQKASWHRFLKVAKAFVFLGANQDVFLDNCRKETGDGGQTDFLFSVF